MATLNPQSTVTWIGEEVHWSKDVEEILRCSSEQTGGRYHICCCCLVTKPCLTLCNSMNCSPLGPSVHGISQARILEWVAISLSRGSSRLRDRTCVSCSGRQILNATREAHEFSYRWAIFGTQIWRLLQTEMCSHKIHVDTQYDGSWR